MRLVCISIIAVLLCSSCRKLVTDEFAEYGPVPVLNSILVAGSQIQVHVSLARKIDAEPLECIENATVTLYADDQFLETILHSGNGIYVGATVIQPNRKYTCIASIPGFEEVIATDSIPNCTTLINISHTDMAGVDKEGNTYPSVSFTFENDTSSEKYYEVLIKILQYDSYHYVTPIFITDPVLLNEGLPLAIFSNEMIKGNCYTMTLNYTTGEIGGRDGVSHTILHPLILEVRSISYHYYLYAKQLHLYEQGRYPEIAGGVILPAQLYSNINNGLGIFTGYASVQSDTIFPSTLNTF